jgi:hypothetical protein
MNAKIDKTKQNFCSPRLFPPSQPNVFDHSPWHALKQMQKQKMNWFNAIIAAYASFIGHASTFGLQMP